MGDSLNSSISNSTPKDLISITDIQAETTAQKRALSYANTIYQLFHQVMDEQQPADRVVSEYFRVNKKHGSKDRRVIRESLFALFRWWGWLSKLGDSRSSQAWFAMLGASATIESHAWHEIVQAWSEFSGQALLKSDSKCGSCLDAPLSCVTGKCEWMNAQFAPLTFTTDELVPGWFWQVCPIEDAAQRLAMVESLSSRPPIWSRAQNIDTATAIEQLNKLDVPATASDYFSDAINLGHKSINLNGLALYKEGKLEIQDLGSQVIGHICAPIESDLWWDACSGAGGKSLQLRSLMLLQNPRSAGNIVASDIRRKPLEELAKRAKRAGFKGISVSPWRSDELPVPHNHFDGVLVDAPCSCTGTWRRNPDMRWIDGIETVQDKPALQLDILRRSSQAVKDGGTLVYATCSLSPLENEQVVNAFLAEQSEFTLEASTHPFTGKQTEMLTVFPFEADSDGMFVARMRRR
ncbi:RsmB/NOP family class I SAM-dependent RNA methyltransferase [Shewanella atlantica]|uniref:RsmB/NOP family class I SAM-dependent RNA methyltransferase n=1 Tax=Shewanella atlantica TaxID=271099 RepID=UPI003735AB07